MGASRNQEHEAAAQAARNTAFPYRDEFAPRSKRLLYEMALQQCSRDSVKSASTVGDDMSAFTLASTSAGSGASGRSASTGSLARPPTGDSQRVVGGVARRRKAAQLKAPLQWEPDLAWIQEKYENEGPAGLASGNFSGHFHAPTNKGHGDRMNAVVNLLVGRVEAGNEAREAPGGVMLSRSLRK